jgi:hypothetical protein
MLMAVSPAAVASHAITPEKVEIQLHKKGNKSSS